MAGTCKHRACTDLRVRPPVEGDRGHTSPPLVANGLGLRGDVVVVAMQANRRIERELGRAGLVELSAHLWAQDCQTCGQPLGAQSPTLVVRSFAVTASASLHHGACRRPEWEGNSSLVFSGLPSPTHVTCALLAPFEQADGHVRLGSGSQGGSMVPALLVNPGLEQVPLRRIPGRRRGGGWVVSTVEIFTRFGLGIAGPGLAVREQAQIARLRGRLLGGELEVDIGPHHWNAPLGREFGDHVRSRGGILLTVTTSVHPGRHRNVVGVVEAMLPAAAAGQLAVGWLGVDAEAPAGEQVEQQQ
jgi:hypothetical protein